MTLCRLNCISCSTSLQTLRIQRGADICACCTKQLSRIFNGKLLSSFVTIFPVIFRFELVADNRFEFAHYSWQALMILWDKIKVKHDTKKLFHWGETDDFTGRLGCQWCTYIKFWIIFPEEINRLNKCWTVFITYFSNYKTGAFSFLIWLWIHTVHFFNFHRSVVSATGINFQHVFSPLSSRFLRQKYLIATTSSAIYFLILQVLLLFAVSRHEATCAVMSKMSILAECV